MGFALLCSLKEQELRGQRRRFAAGSVIQLLRMGRAGPFCAACLSRVQEMLVEQTHPLLCS